MNNIYLEKEKEWSRTFPRVIILEMYYQFMRNYNYLIVDPGSHQSVIVDPAWQMEKIEIALNESRATLSGILITHAHPDHIHLAKPLSEKYNCPIWMSEEEIEVSGFHAKKLVSIDQTPWFVGGLKIQPILTPGHTPGCVCYLVGDNLFTGDVLFAEGCGLCPDVSAAYDMFESLGYLKSVLKPQTRIFPGHCYGKLPGQPFSQLLKENIYLQFDNKDSFAAFRLRSGQKRSKFFDFK